MNDQSKVAASGEKPVIIPVEAYVSTAYAQSEFEKLWSKVWQVACREEEIPRVGDYYTYEIGEESIVVVRSEADCISAYYNVCQHRGRRLTEGCGRAAEFRCKYHGWAWDIHGENTFVLHPEHWGNSFDLKTLRLKEVKVDTWGGWVWINMDPDCEPLKAQLEPAASMLAPYEFEKMRFRWRKWIRLPCNWKTVIEAFNESIHADATHPQFRRYGSPLYWCRSENLCSWHGFSGMPEDQGPARQDETDPGSWMFMTDRDHDPRVVAAEMQRELKVFQDAATTDTMLRAAERLVDELPPGTPAHEVMAHLAASAERDDAARGVIWPQIDPAHHMATGHDWHIFPNLVIIKGVTFGIYYRARPDGHDPDSSIFEVAVFERFPEGEEPMTEWEYAPEPTEEAWLKTFAQDFSNVPLVQKGMKSRGFDGPIPDPVQEAAVIHFHRLLSKYMGVGAPKPLSSKP